MEKIYKIEVDGGELNGADRYYKTRGHAKRGANAIGRKTSQYEKVFVDIYEINIKEHTKKLIETIEY